MAHVIIYSILIYMNKNINDNINNNNMNSNIRPECKMH